MKKILTLAVLTQLITACGNHDPLNTIKNAKIEGYNSTWGESADKLSACKSGTQQWQIKERENKNELNTALFQCELTEQAIAPYNTRLDENAAKSAIRQEGAPVPKITTATLTLEINHWAKSKIETDMVKEFEPSITINYTIPKERHEHLRRGKKYILNDGISKPIGPEKIFAENLNPMEYILPPPPMLSR